MGPQKLSALALPLLLACFFCAIGIEFMIAQKSSGMDFYHYWAVGQCLKEDPMTPIYDNNERSRMGARLYEEAMSRPDAPLLQAAAKDNRFLLTTSTPFLYSCYTICTPDDFAHDLLAYHLLTLGCTLAAIYFLYRLLRMPLLATLALASFILVFFAPLLSDARVGNVNQIQLFLLVLMLWTQTHRSPNWSLLSGVIMGLSVAFKPNLAGVVLLLLAYAATRSELRLFRYLFGGIMAGGLLALAVSFYICKSLIGWPEWLVAIVNLLADFPGWYTAPMGNNSVTLMLKHRTGADLSLLFAGLTLGAPVAVILLSRNRRFLAESGALLASMGALSFLLFSKLVWLHYELLSLPAVFTLLRPGAAGFLFQRLATLVVLVLICSDFYIIRFLGLTPSHILPALTGMEMGTLYLLCLLDLWRAERMGPPANSPVPAPGDLKWTGASAHSRGMQRKISW
jgi:hypothetical protein